MINKIKTYTSRVNYKTYKKFRRSNYYRKFQLTFLDVLITRECYQFHTQVFHKPTSNTSIIPASSMSSRPHKLAAFKSFFHRALSIPSKPEYVEKEVTHIFQIAEQHGFQKEHIARIWQHIKNQTPSQLAHVHSNFPFLGSLSYIPGTSERIIRWLHRKGYRIITTPCTNLFQSLRTDKPAPPSCLRRSGVYCIPVRLPDRTSSSYIGSTIRCLEQRISEHRRSCRDRNIYSALAQSTMSGGSPLWSEATILGQARNTSLLRWKEALFIHARHTINQPSLQLNPTILRATGFRTFISHSIDNSTATRPNNHVPVSNNSSSSNRDLPGSSNLVLAG